MKTLCQMNQAQLKATLSEYLRKKYDKVEITKDYILAFGDIPIALVAHCDTVGYAPPKDIFCDMEQKVMWSPDLLGADDRAGIYAILQIIEAGFRPNVIFTTDEEIGGLGAQALVKKHKKCPFKDLKFIIELDRSGQMDCVFYSCGNENFRVFIESYGFITAKGTFTDISIIAPTWGIAATNLSVGYYYEHNPIEMLRWNELEATIFVVENILKQHKIAPAFKYIEAKHTYHDIGWTKEGKLDFLKNF